MIKKAKRIGSSAVSFFQTISFCFSLSWNASAFYTVLRLLCSFLPTLFSFAQVLMGKHILDLLSGMQKVASPITSLLIYTGVLLFLSILQAVIQKVASYAQSVHGELIQNRLSLFLMDKSLHADLEFFDNAAYYDKMNACTIDAPAMEGLLWNVLSAVSACLSFVMAFFVIAKLKLSYALFMVLAAVPAAIVSAKYTKSLYALSLEQINASRQKSYLQSIALSKNYAQSIRFYQSGNRLRDKYQRLWRQLFDNRLKVNRCRCILSSLFECLPELVAVWIGLDVAVRILGGLATVGDYSLYSGLAAQLWGSIYLLSNAIMHIYDNQLKINNYKTLSQFSNRMQDYGTCPLTCVDSIEFSDVCFTYPGTNTQVLNHVSFFVHPGEKVAIVGLNGSGKSTLIKLLLRFYDVNSGEIRINGKNIQDYPIKTLRQAFSAYFQQEPNYCFTLRENLTIADPDRPDEEAAVYQAFAASGGIEILKKAPKGIDTFLTRLFDQEGMELSVGQYQRIALARTFYRRHSALILDEPSSSLDPESEHRLFAELRVFSEGKTVIFTSHRLSNVVLADRIIVLEYGSILEDGDHDTLMNRKGRYAELFEYQQEQYRIKSQQEV